MNLRAPLTPAQNDERVIAALADRIDNSQDAGLCGIAYALLRLGQHLGAAIALEKERSGQ